MQQKIFIFFRVLIKGVWMKPRAPGQTLLSVAIDQQMLAEIDARRGLLNRSAFVRECLAKYLGIDLSLAAAPDRTGKGGRPPKATSKPKPPPLTAIPGTGKTKKPAARKEAG